MAIAIIQTVTGSATAGTSFLTTTSWTPGANELILVAVATRNTVQVTSVDGNGITFTLVRDQLQTQQTAQTRLSLWRGMSASPTAGQITVTCGSMITAAVAHAHRITGIDVSGTNGSGAVEANTGAETGATDTNAPSVSVTTLTANARAYGAFSHRTQTFTVGSGETAILLNTSIGTSNNATRLSTEYQDVASPSTVTINGTLAAAIDWLAVGVSLKPAGSGTSVSGSDSGTASDGSALEASSSRVDSVAASEGVSVTSAAVGAADSGALADVSSLSQQRAVVAVDGVTAADTAQVTTGPGDQTVVGADAGALTEAPGVIAQALAGSDAAGLAEAVLVTVPIGASDSVGVAEGTSALAWASSSTDALALSDSSALASGSLIAASDSASLADTSLLNTNTLTIASSDGAVLSELATNGLKAATDSAALSDSSSVSASNNVAKAASDSAAVTDAPGAAAIVLSAADVVTLADASALSWASFVTDGAAVSEAAQIDVTLTPVTDSATLADGGALFLTAADVAVVVEMPSGRETAEGATAPPSTQWGPTFAGLMDNGATSAGLIDSGVTTAALKTRIPQ